RRLALGQAEPIEERGRLLDGLSHDLGDRPARDLDAERLRPETRAAAAGARALGHELRDLAARLLRGGFAIAALERLDHALEAAAAHAPYGLLNENMRGETSGKEIPQSAHASFSENVVVAGAVRPPWTEGGLLSTRPGSAPAVLPVVRDVPSVREVPSAPATVSTVTMPSARRSAVSSESARREPRFSRTIS